MSIATSLSALQQAKTDIATAITNKGGTVNQGDGMSDFATDIGTIPTGSEPVIQSKTITANGTYTAPEGVDGYSPVVVNTEPAKGLYFSEYNQDGQITKIKVIWPGETPVNFTAGLGTGAAFSNPELLITEGVTSLNKYSFKSSFFSKITFPLTLTNIGDRAFDGGYGCEELIFNSDITIGEDAFVAQNTTRTLKRVIFRQQAIRIVRYAFEGQYNIELYDFSNCTYVPQLGAANALTHKSDCVIKVPSALLSEWQQATNWCDLTDVVWQGV